MLGCRGLWRGTAPTVLRLGMGAGLHFCFLDSIKAGLERRRPDGKLTSMDAFIAGGLSRAGAAIISCPVTVVKTRMEYGGPGGTHYKVSVSRCAATPRMDLVNSAILCDKEARQCHAQDLQHCQFRRSDRKSGVFQAFSLTCL